MAYLYRMFNRDTVIECLLSEFDERNEKGRLKYSRMYLTLPVYRGTVWLRQTLVIKRGPTLKKNDESKLTFLKLRDIAGNGSCYYETGYPVLDELREFSKDYDAYFLERYKYENVKKKVYTFSKEYPILGRSREEIYHDQVSISRSYKICAVEIRRWTF